jgi:folylpolyglutamate synthase/dihydropteroate synthase
MPLHNFCCTLSRIIMHRVCRDPQLPVQARLWPPDVLFGGFPPLPPQIFQKKLGITQTSTSKWHGSSPPLANLSCHRAGWPLWLDTAHTHASMIALVDTLTMLWKPPRRVVLILGAAEDKVPQNLVASLSQLPLAHVLCVDVAIAGASTRAFSPTDLALFFSSASKVGCESRNGAAGVCGGQNNVKVRVVRSTSDADATSCALDIVRQRWLAGSGCGSEEQPLVVVTGSTYVVSNAVHYLERHGLSAL